MKPRSPLTRVEGNRPVYAGEHGQSHDDAGLARRALRTRTYARVMRASAEIHEGIPEAEFVAALKVLQRMIHNVGGKAWHH